MIQNQLVFCQVRIIGEVISPADEPEAYTNVLLLLSKDSTFVKGAVSDQEGQFIIKDVTPGDYTLSISMTGYQTNYSSPFVVNGSNDSINSVEDYNLGKIILNPSSTLLKEVEITARKPLYEQQIDRLVINVESSITLSGGNALEVLARSPGISVNEINKVLSINGKDGVSVMIDGNHSQMPQDVLIEMLRGMDANNIDKIEIYDTPPANFNAEGNAGVINIILKQNKGNGINGSYSLSIAHGKNLRYGGTGNLNYRNDKINLYGSYSLSHQITEATYSFHRTVNQNGLLVVTDSENKRIPQLTNNNNARFGIDYNITDNTILGLLLSGYIINNENDSENFSTFSKQGSPFSIVESFNKEIEKSKHGMVNLNLQHQFSQKERISFDIDYLYYKSDNPSNYDNSFFDGEGTLDAKSEVSIKKVTPTDNLSAKIDYQTSINEKIEFQVGIKGTNSQFNNLIEVYDVIGNDLIKNELFSQDYLLKEKIAAVYSSFNFNLSKKTKIIAGLRYEYTDYLLATQNDPNFIDRNFGYLFPSFFISNSFDDYNQLQFSYSRRISRPAFRELAPFVTFIDPNTFFSGNPELRPGISDNLKASYSYKNINLSFQYSYSQDFIVRYQPVLLDPGTNTQVYTTLNLDKEHFSSITLNFSVYPTKWWEIQSTISGNYEKSSFYSSAENNNLTIKRIIVDMVHTFTLPKKIVLEIAGKYQNSGYYGLLKVQPKGYINIGLQKKLTNNKGTFRLNITDVFRTNIWNSITNIPALSLDNTARFDSETRVLRLTYSRNFGNAKVKATRKRATSSSEEQGRFN